jgi:hypothetical protein
VEQTVMPYLSAFATFRENVRRVARQQKGETFVAAFDIIQQLIDFALLNLC